MALSAGLPDEFFRTVALECRATIDGEVIFVRIELVEAAYNDPVAREHVEASIRHALLEKILQKCPPKVHVRR